MSEGARTQVQRGIRVLAPFTVSCELVVERLDVGGRQRDHVIDWTVPTEVSAIRSQGAVMADVRAAHERRNRDCHRACT
jgi:hypothetical protein